MIGEVGTTPPMHTFPCSTLSASREMIGSRVFHADFVVLVLNAVSVERNDRVRGKWILLPADIVLNAVSVERNDRVSELAPGPLC